MTPHPAPILLRRRQRHARRATQRVRGVGQPARRLILANRLPNSAITRPSGLILPGLGRASFRHESLSSMSTDARPTVRASLASRRQPLQAQSRQASGPPSRGSALPFPSYRNVPDDKPAREVVQHRLQEGRHVPVVEVTSASVSESTAQACLIPQRASQPSSGSADETTSCCRWPRAWTREGVRPRALRRTAEPSSGRSRQSGRYGLPVARLLLIRGQPEASHAAIAPESDRSQGT